MRKVNAAIVDCYCPSAVSLGLEADCLRVSKTGHLHCHASPHQPSGYTGTRFQTVNVNTPLKHADTYLSYNTWYKEVVRWSVH